MAFKSIHFLATAAAAIMIQNNAMVQAGGNCPVAIALDIGASYSPSDTYYVEYTSGNDGTCTSLSNGGTFTTTAAADVMCESLLGSDWCNINIKRTSDNAKMAVSIASGMTKNQSCGGFEGKCGTGYVFTPTSATAGKVKAGIAGCQNDNECGCNSSYDECACVLNDQNVAQCCYNDGCGWRRSLAETSNLRGGKQNRDPQIDHQIQNR
ncbi:MAG: hypothetical protein SGARI_001627 [Bacillariaceae sp.]